MFNTLELTSRTCPPYLSFPMRLLCVQQQAGEESPLHHETNFDQFHRLVTVLCQQGRSKQECRRDRLWREGRV
jgi:hypothetical protein